MFQVYKTIFNGLPSWEKAIFIFWSVCFVLFVFSYAMAVIELIKMKFKKNKPQTF